MGITELERTVLTYSQTGYKEPNPQDVPGSTPFVTGNAVVDHFLNHMLVDHGIKVTVKEGRVFFCQIDRVEIVDEARATWFLMQCK